ncbi:hypothetical protein EON81_11045 [bacterium]|nr:MAG: hypothetical protein EON81_11045 [bacterium]
MSALALVLLPLFASEPLEPAPLTRFNGASWSGIRLSESTDADIKRSYRTEKGAVRPEALKIVTDRPKDVRVDALLDGRGGKATVRAIRVEYAFGAPTVDDLSDAFNETAEDYFLPGRNDDWKLWAFPKQGVLAFSLKGIVSTFYLATPEGVARVLSNYRDRQTPVVPVPDPGADWDRTVVFGDSDVTLFVGENSPGDLDDSTRRRIRDGVRDSIEGIRGRNIRFSDRKNGTLVATLRTGKFNDEGAADGTVALNLTVTTPYGRLERSVSKSKRIRPRYRDAFLNLTDDALDALKTDLTEAIRRLGPPTPEKTRETAVQGIYAGLTGL